MKFYIKNRKRLRFFLNNLFVLKTIFTYTFITTFIEKSPFFNNWRNFRQTTFTERWNITERIRKNLTILKRPIKNPLLY